MAKGNLFLGTAARSVGDVVMYRREGAQVSRVRVRKIANPKTDAQCLQRAFMSACVKFYQPLANVLDRSWQGKSRAKSYAAFLKANAPIVRAEGIYIPKNSGFAPIPVKLSEGTITPLTYTTDGTGLMLTLAGITSETSNPTTIGALSTIFVGAGYKSGDVVTIIVSSQVSGKNLPPISAQFIVDTTSTETIANAMPVIATIEVVGANGSLIITLDNQPVIGGAVIIARNVDGVWQRSTQFYDVEGSVISEMKNDAAKTACIESYKGAAASDNPLVYLDGDELTD